MIVLPVEKRFDWSRPPLALLALVLLNVAVFLFYQTGDGPRLQLALASYGHQGFFEQEWPRYQEYLAARGERETLERVRAERAEAGPAAVSYRMLLDRDFVADLDRVWGWQLAATLGADWRTRRAVLADTLRSVSSVRFGLTPAESAPATFVSYAFLHGGLAHLFGNLFFLVLCGFTVEAAIGSLRFLGFYLIAGVLAGVGHVAVDPASAAPLIGASGAVSGVMAMYVALFRMKRIEFFYWIGIFVGYVRLPALAVLPAWIVKELWLFASEPDAAVAFVAHATGFLVGGLLIGALLLLRRDVLDEEYIETDQDADPHREAFARVFDAIGDYRFEAALRSLDALAEEHGDTPDTERLRHQLLKVVDPARADVTGVELLSRRDASHEDLRLQQRILELSPGLLDALDDTAALQRLGSHLCRSDDLDGAERVLARLEALGARGAGVAALARALAERFEAARHGEKARRYAALAARTA